MLSIGSFTLEIINHVNCRGNSYLPAGFGMPGMSGMYAINTVNGMALAGQIGYPVSANTHAFAPRTVGKQF